MKDSVVCSNAASSTKSEPGVSNGTPKKCKRNLLKLKSVEKKTELNGASKVEGKENTNEITNGILQSPKINAFQFMMNSRHRKSSPGGEVDLNGSPEAVSGKKELKERKRNAVKRKRGDEEIGDVIIQKPDKKGKRLKPVISVECSSDDEVITKRRKSRRITTDSEESSDEKDVIKGRKNRLSLKKKNVDINGESDKLPLTPNSVKMWKFKIKLKLDENSEMIVENNVSTENSVEIDLASDGHDKSVATDLPPVGETSVENDPPPVEIGQTSVMCDLANENNLPVDTTQSTSIVEVDLTSVEGKVTPENTATDNEVEVDGMKDRGGRVLRERKARPKAYDDYFLLEWDDDEGKKDKKEKKKVKVAPVFLKAVPKPKLDPKVIEARRQFLMSGVPSSLKREMEKQQCIAEADFDVFPTISHVQQKSTDNIYWDLPRPELDLSIPSNDKIKIMPYALRNLLNIDFPQELTNEEFTIPEKIKNCKKIIKEIKSQNPNYPVYKIFNTLYERSGYKTKKNEITNEKITPKRRGRKKKTSLEKKPEIAPVKSEDSQKYALWTEKYKARNTNDIIGNHSSVASLKEWLVNWLEKDKRKKINNSGSESEFEVDSDSRDSTIFGNTVTLKGPTGSGKTSAVYAVCNELGFDVLEVNASSKRTGKRLLQELQEATQSHQVHKKENIFSFVEKEKETPKMCVLLVEDVDIVFDQDEGFTAALLQIIATSKRPIILTANDEPTYSIQRIINDYQTIIFAPLSPILTVWLQILCVIEGYFVSLESLEELLCYHKGDIRRTLLQLQLWHNSGGELNKSGTTIEPQMETNEVHLGDDSNFSDLKPDDASDSVEMHYDCVNSTHIVKKFNSFSLPHCNNLEMIWWNFSNILNLPNFSNFRLEREGKCNTSKKTKDKRELESLLECYDSLAFADVMCGKNRFYESLQRWRVREKDSLSLEENLTNYVNQDLSNDLTQTLLSGAIKQYRDNYQEDNSRINVIVPSVKEQKWRSKQLSCEEKLQGALLSSDVLQRKAVALDYMPTLRSIARSEFERAAHNVKRKNRFYHYLRNLGVHGSDSTYRSICDVLRIWD